MPTSVVSAWLATPEAAERHGAEAADDGRVGEQEQRLGNERPERGQGQPQDLGVRADAAP